MFSCRLRLSLALALASLTPAYAAPAPVHPALPAPPPSEPRRVTLPELLAIAHAHSPLLALDQAYPARARAASARAGASLPENPELGLAIGPRISGAETGVDFEVSLSQRFAIGGERAARRRAGDALVVRLDAEAVARQWDLHTAVHGAFHRALAAEARLDLARDVLAFQEEVGAITAKQRRAGEVAALAQRVADAEVAGKRQAVAAAEQQAVAARLELAQLVGWPDPEPPWPAGTLDDLRPAPALADVLARARERQPRFAVLEAAVAEARAEAGVARKTGTPEPVVGISYSHESQPGGGAGAHIVSGFVTLPLPLVRLDEPAVGAARAEVAVREAELAEAEQRLGYAVRRAHADVVAARARLASYGSDVLPRFRENLELLKRAFQLGEIDLLALSSARERFLAIQESGLGARADYYDALAELESASGIDILDAHHLEDAP